MLRIKELRESFGFTQKDLATKIGSTNKNIWAYENNFAEPNIETLTRLASVFECSVGYLLGIEDDFGAVIPTVSPALSSDEQAVIDCMRNVGDVEREIITENAKNVYNAYKRNKKAGII